MPRVQQAAGWALGLGLVALGGTGFYLGWWGGDGRDVAKSARGVASDGAAKPGKPDKSKEPEIRYPIAGASGNPGQPGGATAASGATASLPDVDESDPTFVDGLLRVIGKERAESLLSLKDVIRKWVTLVSHVTEKRQLTADLSPVKSPEGPFVADGAGENLSISPRSYARYVTYVTAFREVNLDQAVALYVRFYPLFQSAYEDLGSPGYFNDRVIDAIDLLLATPDTHDPVKLTSETVTYRYADAGAEALPAAQKLLMRMGAENETQLKARLKDLREKLVAQSKRLENS